GMMKGKRIQSASDRMYTLKSVIDSSVRGQTDIGVLATRDAKSSAIMVWNYHDEDKLDAGAQVQVTVNNIPAKSVKLTQYRIDQEHSNSYEVWKKMGSPQQPTAAQISTLEKAGALQTMGKVQTIKPVGGNAVINISLPRQAVTLLKMDW
ncbi:MAG: beta-xylosidase, partial [Chitinophagaceae bacterium]